ncbi:MAG: mechanosensitive ion channel [Myxococcales bacterium]|nr:mechanosensitive ion channel [Myxococcales bacterium]MCB9583547.1 mechanosensitive ion channel [Polyangiaceae bacterium]
MGWLGHTLTEAKSAGTLWLLALVLLNTLLSRTNRERRLVVTPLVLLALHLIMVLVLGVLKGLGSAGHTEARLAALIFGAIAATTALGSIVFNQVLARLKLRVPRILEDVVVGAASVIAVLTVASRTGLNLSGLIATSAVLTAVVGLSLQDTLGNILSGLALQTDDSIHVNDWIKVGDMVGRVKEIRWRYTAIETRNWETVIFPNSMLVKGQVIVLGRREEQPTQWRRWIWFNVDFRFPPPDVLAAVNEALAAAPIERVSDKPQAHAILMDFKESYCRYAARYWLTDLAVDDPTDSAVRVRIYFALRRAGIPLSIPAHAIFVTEESSQRELQKGTEEHERRVRMLAGLDLFDSLSSDEHAALATGLRYAPFAAGETLTRQGAEAHWLYIVESGEVAVMIRDGKTEKEVARIGAGEFFGERSLLTGDPRSATIVARTQVECWRLDQAVFRELLERRPEIAEEVAEVLARREAELDQVREDLSQEAAARRMAETKTDLVARIRSFFKLDD